MLVLAACAPTQNDSVRYGLRRVYIVTGDGTPNAFPRDTADNFALAITDASALGPTFVRVASRADADLIVEHFDSGPGCSAGAAQFTVGGSTIRIDPVCTQGLLVQRAALVHELGHAVGMSHVCRQPGEARDCSPVGFGAATMNPALTYGDDSGPTLDTAYAGPVPSFVPTELDLAEFRRTHP